MPKTPTPSRPKTVDDTPPEKEEPLRRLAHIVGEFKDMQAGYPEPARYPKDLQASYPEALLLDGPFVWDFRALLDMVVRLGESKDPWLLIAACLEAINERFPELATTREVG